MGDFNSVCDITIDKSSKRGGGTCLEFFFELVKQEKLEDVWRLKNCNVKNYTFFSASNKMWSRIDMMWMNKMLCSWVKKIEIKPRFLSDHSPIISSFRPKFKIYNWRLNEKLLKKTENIKFLQKEIKEFFRVNWSGETNNRIVWDAFKAFMGGGGYCPRSKRERNERKKYE